MNRAERSGARRAEPGLRAAPYLVRALADLGPDLTFAPERHHAARLGQRAAGVPLASLVVERTQRVRAEETRGAIVLDTSHAKDGLVDLAAAARALVGHGEAASAKKRVFPGDLLVSRLRPYLRQIAIVHPRAAAAFPRRAIVCSPEFFVLAAAPAAAAAGDDGAPVAWLVPFLLGAHAQEVLAAGQEGGHHPRVARDTLLGLRVPAALVARRAATSARVLAAQAEVHAALAGWRATLVQEDGRGEVG
jgi:hypothetical protein